VRRNVFVTLWLLATAVFGWQLAQGVHDFDGAVLPALPIALALTIALIWFLPGPRATQAADEPKTRRGRLLLLSLAALLLLMVISSLVGPPLLYGIMVLAVAVLLWLRQPISRREAAYAAVLAIVAALAALPMTGAKFPPPLWAAMQIALVVPCLLAGWGLLRKTGLATAGIGRSLLLSDGWRTALTGAVQGAIIGIPWALLNPLLGGSNNDASITAWWHPFCALQPGIAEEAWGRMLPVPLLVLLLRRYARTPAALTASVLVAGYWFAWLHTNRGFDASSLISTLMIGTLYALPVTYLWLRRGLETAMGFHFWQDFVRWVVAYLINTGVWFS
jgi:hypothetical protein